MMLGSCLYPNQIYRDVGREDVSRPRMFPFAGFQPSDNLICWWTKQ